MAFNDGAVADSATPTEAALIDQLFHQYGAIDKSKRTFRLLILRAGTGHDINCELVESTIEGNTLPYEAVSYTWGPNFTADTVNINGRKLPVTFNLSLILRDLRSADVDRVIWVDALCINQQDATEKGHQVGQMQYIFALADRVLFYIARPTNYTDILMDSLDRLQSEIPNVDLSDGAAISACWSEVQTAIARHHLNSQPQPSESLLSVQLEALIFLQRQGLEYILGQPWFHRVWILQEVANARDALVYCGQKSVSAAVFALGARLLEYSLPDEQRKTIDEVLNLMPGHMRREKPSQDILSLFRRFGKANASVERDRIYALFGICEDKQIQIYITPNYIKSEQEVIIDTIAYICHCEASAIGTTPYNSIAHLLSDPDLFDNTLLSHFLRSRNYKGTLSFLRSRGHYISVTPDILNMAVNDTMMKEGVMSQLIMQRNADTLLSGQEGSKPLRFAAEHGYDTLVRQMLEKGAFIEAHDPKENIEERKTMTPLSLAAMNGHENVVKILLEKGANMTGRHRREGAPLAWAARSGHISVVQLLVERGSNIEDDGLQRRTPLSWAANGGYEAIVRFLLKHGADSTRELNYRSDMPLSRAAENGHRLIIQILLENCAKVDRLCMESALICAATSAQISIVSLLLDVDASINMLNVLDAMVENTWEEYDRREDYEVIVRMLLAKGAHFRESSNPLVKAAAAGNERMVRLFLDNGAEVDYIGARHTNWSERNYFGTALAFAVRYGYKDVAELLLAEGADLEAQDSDEHTPLIVAARSGHENVVRLLLEKGADNRAKDCDGQPPFAGALRHWNIVKLLLEEGPDVSVRECNGQPLLRAARDGRGDIVNMLLARGADVDTWGEDDLLTPLLHAADKGHVDVVDLLLENGADIEVRGGKLNQTPLHLAAESGHGDTVRVLLENGADIASRDRHERTPLHLAAESGKKDVVEVLLENGARIEAKDRWRSTPLTRAANRNWKNVVTLLLESGANPNVHMALYDDEDDSYVSDARTAASI